MKTLFVQLNERVLRLVIKLLKLTCSMLHLQLLVLVSLLVSVFPYRCWRGLISGFGRDGKNKPVAKWQRKLIDLIKWNAYSSRFNCLASALAGGIFLKIFNISSQMRVGVSIAGDHRVFHAWLVIGSEIIVGWKRNLRQYRLLTEESR